MENSDSEEDAMEGGEELAMEGGEELTPEQQEKLATLMVGPPSVKEQ